MPEYRFTEYFEREVLRKRPYLRREWCIAVIARPIRFERQEDNGIASGQWCPNSAAGIFES
jgi:hypothetical protein